MTPNGAYTHSQFHPLQMETRTNKKAKLHQSSDSIQLSGHALKLVVQCLHPRDVLHCIQTCRQWKNEIDEEVWKEVTNNISPMTSSAIEAVDAEQKLAYRRIALALACPTDRSPPELPFPKPTLRLQDILYVIEIRDTISMQCVGAWSGDLAEIVNSNSSEEYFTYLNIVPRDSKQVQPPSIFVPTRDIIAEMLEDDEFNPFYETPPSVYTNLEMTSRLIRLDSSSNMCGKCFCLNEFKGIEEYVGPDDLGPEGLSADAYFATNEIRPTSPNPPGSIARDLCYNRHYNYLSFRLEIRMRAVFADDDSSNQSSWQLAAREGKPRASWMSSMEKETRLFEYQIENLRFVSRVSTNNDIGANDKFDNVSDLLLFFEGLNWK